jgi:hypothetical protein
VIAPVHNRQMQTVTWTRTGALHYFILLQCLDVLTTVMFLGKGVAEGNPVMAWSMSIAHGPWVGLILAKLAAALIGQYCYRTGRMPLLRRANAGYSLVVGWNLIAIAAGALAR